MPLLQNDTPAPVPSVDLVDGQQFFEISYTKEIFLDYNDYIDRVMLYQEKIWSCALSGKSNLSYKEALSSERDCYIMVNKLPKDFVHVALHLIQGSSDNLDRLADRVYNLQKKHFFEDQIVHILEHGKSSNSAWMGKISAMYKILDPVVEKVKTNAFRVVSSLEDPSFFEVAPVVEDCIVSSQDNNILKNQDKDKHWVEATALRYVPSSLISKGLIRILIRSVAWKAPFATSCWMLKSDYAQSLKWEYVTSDHILNLRATEEVYWERDYVGRYTSLQSLQDNNILFQENRFSVKALPNPECGSQRALSSSQCEALLFVSAFGKLWHLSGLRTLQGFFAEHNAASEPAAQHFNLDEFLTVTILPQFAAAIADEYESSLPGKSARDHNVQIFDVIIHHAGFLTADELDTIRHDVRRVTNPDGSDDMVGDGSILDEANELFVTDSSLSFSEMIPLLPLASRYLLFRACIYFALHGSICRGALDARQQQIETLASQLSVAEDKYRSIHQELYLIRHLTPELLKAKEKQAITGSPDKLERSLLSWQSVARQLDILHSEGQWLGTDVNGRDWWWMAPLQCLMVKLESGWFWWRSAENFVKIQSYFESSGCDSEHKISFSMRECISCFWTA